MAGVVAQHTKRLGELEAAMAHLRRQVMTLEDRLVTLNKEVARLGQDTSDVSAWTRRADSLLLELQAAIRDTASAIRDLKVPRRRAGA